MGSSASTNNNATQAKARPKTSPSRNKTVVNGDAGGSQKRDAPKSAAARTTNPGDPPNYHRSQIPPPRPPRTSKTDIFSLAKYKEVDDYVLNAPPKLLVGNFNELVKYLTRDNERWDDMCKLRAVFLWVTSIDVYNLKVDGVPPTHSPLEYFTKIQCNMGNHAHLISGLCQMAGIPCVIISGMNKSAAYDIGSKCDRKSMGAQWNAVYVNDDWRFLDAFWASACVVGRKSGEWTLVDSDGNITQEDEETSEGTTQHRINEFYFLPDPDKLIWTHFPDEPQWQLLDRPVTQREFEEHVYVRERFHYLGMKLMPNSHDKCLLTASDGELELVFSLPVQQSETSRFKYMLYQGRAERGSGDQSDLFLDRFVMFEHTANLLRFTLRFPIKGKFKMDIFGLDINESDIFDLACTYIITCNEPKANCLPLPDLPPIGWGPGANAKEAGLKPITHDGAIIVTKDGNVEIRLAAEKDIQLHQMLKHALIDEATLSNYAVTRLENGEAVVNIRLPQGGEYALKLYADAAGSEGSAPNVLNYLIKSDAKNIHNQPFPNVADGTLGKKPAAANLGVKAISHKGGNIQAKNGRARVEFQARAGVQVMVELHTSDELACKTMAVMPKEENGKWTFDLDMPDQGEYSLNVFACNKNSTDRIYNVHTYLVQSDGRKLEPGELDARNEKKNVLTNIPIETVQTSDNEVLIPVPPGFENIAASLHRRNANDPPNANQVDIIEQDGMQLIRAKLPEFGEYLLNLYDRDTGGVVRNIAKYQINRRPPGELYEDNTKLLMSQLGAQAPIMEEDEEDYDAVKLDKNETDEDKKTRQEEEQRRATRRQIQKAIDMKDAEMLERYIQAYEKLNPPFDDEILQKARRTLAALDAKEALTEACQRRDIEALKKAIARAKDANFDHHLDLQLALANRLRDQLERIEKLRHSVLNLDSKTIAEIKTYPKPPDGVNQSMMATFILLGNTPKEVRNWRTCQALLGKTGRESLMRRISSFDPKDCSIAVAQQAKYFIENYSMSQIRDVSAGAAAFYGWLHEFVREVTNFVLCEHEICDDKCICPSDTNKMFDSEHAKGDKEFIPIDNEQPGPSNEQSRYQASAEAESNRIAGKRHKLAMSTTESIDLIPGGTDKDECYTNFRNNSETESFDVLTKNSVNQVGNGSRVSHSVTNDNQCITSDSRELKDGSSAFINIKMDSNNISQTDTVELDSDKKIKAIGNQNHYSSDCSQVISCDTIADTQKLLNSKPNSTEDAFDRMGFSTDQERNETNFCEANKHGIVESDTDHANEVNNDNNFETTVFDGLSIETYDQNTVCSNVNIINVTPITGAKENDWNQHESHSIIMADSADTVKSPSPTTDQNRTDKFSKTVIHTDKRDAILNQSGQSKIIQNRYIINASENLEFSHSVDDLKSINKINHVTIRKDKNFVSTDIGQKCDENSSYDYNSFNSNDSFSEKFQSTGNGPRNIVNTTDNDSQIPFSFTPLQPNENCYFPNDEMKTLDNIHPVNDKDRLSQDTENNDAKYFDNDDTKERKNSYANLELNIHNSFHGSVPREKDQKRLIAHAKGKDEDLPDDYDIQGVSGFRDILNGTEDRIFIPTDIGENSNNDSDSERETENRLNVNENSEEDLAELKALVELTKDRQFSKTANALEEGDNETTNGHPSEDYVQFVREKTGVSIKTKHLKKKHIKRKEKTKTTKIAHPKTEHAVVEKDKTQKRLTRDQKSSSKKKKKHGQENINDLKLLSLGMIEEIESTGGSGAGLVSQPPTKQERPKTNRGKKNR